MGDVGSLDDHGRFWYHGRKSQRVETGRESLFTESVEAAFNQHPAVNRCALVSLGSVDTPVPVIVVESRLRALKGRRQGMLSNEGAEAWNELVEQLKKLGAASPKANSIGKFLLIPELPVDVRHNAKINREEAAAWAMDIIRDFGLESEYGLVR
jgi:acyl-coenzyme A synthetase/AMP-(fatty) acid ligase